MAEDLPGELDRVRRTWDALGRGDALSAIYGWPERRDWRVDEFLATGEREIDDFLARAEALGLPARREAALDFGCGVGRLTQALAARFDLAVGVDVAPSMIEAAERLNSFGERCRYVLNEQPSLPFDGGAFDLVYSNLVLQHMPTALGRAFVAELARVLRGGGLLAFQVPHDRVTLPRLSRRAVLAEVCADAEALELRPGGTYPLRVRVRNASSEPWSGADGHRALALGNHWVGADGALVGRDDGRTPLGRDVAPGEEVELELDVTAPAEPGEYVIELDVVQEQVGWFAERRKLSRRRSRPGRVRARVAAGAPPPPPTREETEPRMEMHALPREEVVALLEAAGARVLDVQRDSYAGPAWISLRYLATRDA